jgi:hypothetical protein
MKLENFILATRVLTYIQKNPNCTIPEIRDFYGIESYNPPQREEKDLYKVISYLDNENFIEKIDNRDILPRGAHYFLKITPRGTDFISSYKDLFSDISNENLSEDLSSDFSVFSFAILNNLKEGLLDQLPYDTRRLLTSRKARINVLIKKYHAQLQEKVSRIINSLK